MGSMKILVLFLLLVPSLWGNPTTETKDMVNKSIESLKKLKGLIDSDVVQPVSKKLNQLKAKLKGAPDLENKVRETLSPYFAGEKPDWISTMSEDYRRLRTTYNHTLKGHWEKAKEELKKVSVSDKDKKYTENGSTLFTFNEQIWEMYEDGRQNTDKLLNDLEKQMDDLEAHLQKYYNEYRKKVESI